MFAIVSLIIFPQSSIQARIQPTADYATSNSMVDNVQATKPISGAAVDPGTPDYCNQSSTFKASAESMIAIDPLNPAHLVGTSQLIHNFDRTGRRFSGFDGVETSTDGGASWDNKIIQGFECTRKEKITNQTAYRTTDPVVAFGPGGKLYSVILPVFRAGGAETAVTLYVAKSSDGGAIWTVANGGSPVFNAVVANRVPDKPWITVDDSATSRFRGTIYIAWTAFDPNGNSAILLSKSTDEAHTFAMPVEVSPTINPREYQFAIPVVASDGTLYVNFIGSCHGCALFDELVAKSTNGGDSFDAPITVGSFVWHNYPHTNFRAGIYESFTANPANGHLILAVANATKTVSFPNSTTPFSVRSDILLYESSDTGETWSMPLVANDNAEDINTIQPVVSVSPNGLVAVAFYDRRLPCPDAPGILPADIGRSNLCVDTSIQFFSDQDSLKPTGNNIRVTKSSWDPNNSGSLGGKGIPLPFIGDYFGLALTNTTAYPFFAANYDLGENPTYDLRIFVGRINPVKASAEPLNWTIIGLVIAIVAIIVSMLYLIRKRRLGVSRI
jgi:hypothetical protein